MKFKNSKFYQYFFKRLILTVAVILFFIIQAYHKKFSYEGAIFLSIFAFLSTTIYSLMNFLFYEVKYDSRVLEYFQREPLNNFISKDFKVNSDSQLEGKINGYQVFLIPYPKLDKKHLLIIMILFQNQKGLEKYFEKSDDTFRFRVGESFLYAETTLEKFDSKYSYQSIYKLIDEKTKKLKDDGIKPI